MPLPHLLSSEHRPRERLMRHGATVLTDVELMAIMLRTGSRGCDALEMGRQLVMHFGSLRALLAAPPAELTRHPGLGLAKAAQIAAVSELSKRAMTEALAQGGAMDHPDRVKQYCAAALAHRKVEHCIALYLNVRLQLSACVELCRGTLAEAVVYPREVVRGALEQHAAAVILAHNHPSGSVAPSAADIAFTARVKAALALVDIRLVDHLIVAGHHTTSLAELGHL